MVETSGKKTAKQVCAAVLAHVDAGKTTLLEQFLYLGGLIRKTGRVDKGDSFFDTDRMERARGITIFSKQAIIRLPELELTLLDTPGHVDFSSETERVLCVLDYAILVISGADGVQGHTKTLWNLLKKYQIPVFLFVNKMDQDGIEKTALLAELKQKLDEDCVDFCDAGTDSFYEDIASLGERAMEQYFENGSVEEDEIRRLISLRRLFPCYFGSALKNIGVEEFFRGFTTYTKGKEYPDLFGARVFKIMRDGQGKRMTCLKVTGGSLKVRQTIRGGKWRPSAGEETEWEEKVSQIRLYSGEKYETADEAPAGTVCAVTGLSQTYAGEGIGNEKNVFAPCLCPVLTCQIGLPDGMDAAAVLPKLRELEEEDPQLQIIWKEELKEIQVRLMGEVQMEILKNLLHERFGLAVTFGEGNIVYKETIASRTEGVGHFEPLRHYAEVHLLLEPLPAGSGVVFAADCSEDVLSKNWQRLILTHLAEREHIGVLTGAALTDIKITLKSGRAHQKHTEGGDFRQATYRAVRQGVMQAKSVLLEPVYLFSLTVPQFAVGRAMTDIERMYGTAVLDDCEQTGQDGEFRTLTGSAPVATMQHYQKEVLSYTKGQGRLTVAFGGYAPCHNADEVIEAAGYDAAGDLANTPDSVFCAHGAGFIVEWFRVPEYMHLESIFSKEAKKGSAAAGDYEEDARAQRTERPQKEEVFLGTEEIDRILSRAVSANKRDHAAGGKSGYQRKSRSEKAVKAAPVTRTYRQKPRREEYLLVDGYNIIFAWNKLKRLAEENFESARGRLLDIMCNYQAVCGAQVIVVFDAYRVAGHKAEFFDYHNIHVVYTKEAETADHYIERFAHDNAAKYQVSVATSDGMEQIIIRGVGCRLLSARDLEQEIESVQREIRETYMDGQPKGKTFLMDEVDLDGILQSVRERKEDASETVCGEDGAAAGKRT